MASITQDDLGRMRGELLFDGAAARAKLSRFWILLVLAAVIASAGIISDSTATVIGAMIVAPLMTPILGTVVSIVTADLRNLARCLLLVVAGALAVIVVGWAAGYLTPVEVTAAVNSQVAGRVHPRLADLVGALATGAVGAFAVVRSDVSDTLPGVAIAISLVPPLAVVGLTLNSGAPSEAAGAGLLFLTNVGAILLSGLVVMALFRVRDIATAGDAGHRRLGDRAATAVVVVSVAALVLPLSVSSERISTEAVRRADVTDVADAWAAARDWEVVAVDASQGAILVRAVGPLPIPDAGTLRTALDRGGLRDVDVRLELTPAVRADLPGH